MSTYVYRASARGRASRAGPARPGPGTLLSGSRLSQKRRPSERQSYQEMVNPSPSKEACLSVGSDEGATGPHADWARVTERVRPCDADTIQSGSAARRCSNADVIIGLPRHSVPSSRGLRRGDATITPKAQDSAPRQPRRSIAILRQPRRRNLIESPGWVAAELRTTSSASVARRRSAWTGVLAFCATHIRTM